MHFTLVVVYLVAIVVQNCLLLTAIGETVQMDMNAYAMQSPDTAKHIDNASIVGRKRNVERDDMYMWLWLLHVALDSNG